MASRSAKQGFESKPFFIHYFRPPDRKFVFEAELLYADSEVIVTSHILSGASKPLVIAGEVVIENGYRAVFAEFCKHWYDVARIFRPDGTFTGYYADINTPSQIHSNGYRTKDLFLDLWISPDRSSITVLDEDEFREAIEKQWITSEEAVAARTELAGLIANFNRGAFPPPILERFS